MGESTVPVTYSTRDIVRELSNEWPDWTYDDVLLEMVAQFDPTKRVLDGYSSEEKAAYAVLTHDLEPRNIEDVSQPVDLLDEGDLPDEETCCEDSEPANVTDVDEPATT